MPKAKALTKADTIAFPITRTTAPEDSRLQNLARIGANDLNKALMHSEDQILKDLTRLKEEEGESGKFKIALSLTMSLDGTTIDTAVAYSVKAVTKQTHELPDGNQSLPGMED